MAFNVEEFLQSTITETLDTTRPAIPPGDYVAQINSDDKAVSMDKGTIGKGDRAGQEWAAFVVLMTIPDPSGTIKAVTGRDPVIIRHSIFLDLTPNGKLDLSTGKNIDFAKLFAACGWPTDEKGKLTSGFAPSWLKGKTLKIKVTNEPDRKDSSITREVISAVTKA